VAAAKVIDVQQLTYNYPKAEEPAVRAMDFAVRHGEIFGFLGPSGAVKDMILDLKAHGRNIFLTTHDMSTADAGTSSSYRRAVRAGRRHHDHGLLLHRRVGVLREAGASASFCCRWWPYLLGGLVYNLALSGLLLRRFIAKNTTG